MSERRFVVRGTHTLDVARDEIAQMLENSEGLILRVEHYYPKRRPAQNGLFRMWCNEIAAATHNDRDKIYDLMKRQFGVWHWVNGDYVPMSTADYNTAQMGILNERIRDWATEHGYPLTDPEAVKHG